MFAYLATFTLGFLLGVTFIAALIAVALARIDLFPA
jgi:hypothetical protein